MLARSRRGANLLQRVARAFSGGGGDAPVPPEAPLVFTRREKDSSKLGYYVLKEPASSALAILEGSLSGQPVPGPAGTLRASKPPPPGVCNRMLAQAAKDAAQAERAAEIAEALMVQGTPLDASTLRALFASLARADALPAALPLLDAWLQQQEEALEADAGTHVPLQIMTLLMDTATRAENTQVVLQVLARMARIGVTPSPQSLTTLLQCFMRLGQVQVAHRVLDWMRRNNLEPNVYSYTALLAMPRHMPDSAAPQLLAQAREAYDKMQRDGVAPNARFFTEFLRICGRAGDLQAALAAWEDAREAQVAPDLILFSAMIDACAKCGDPGAALRVFEEMKSSRVPPDVVAYTSLLTALQGSPQAAATAREVWRGMQADGVQPNGMAVAAFLEILLLEGEIDEALQALAAAQPGGRDAGGAAGQTKWQRKAQRMLAASGLLEEAQQVDAPAAGAPGAAAAAGEEGGQGAGNAAIHLPRLYEHFLFAMAHKGQYAVVEQMARHMRQRGLHQTLGTASALLTAQALQHGRSAAKWLLQPPGLHSGGLLGGGRPSGGGAPVVLLPDEAIDSCLLGRGSPQACMAKLMQQVAADGSSSGGNGGGGSSVPVSTDVANVVLGGLAVRGLAREAFELYAWMQLQGPQPQGQPQQQAAPGSQQGASTGWCSPNEWTLSLLLYAALNAPKEQQLELALRAVQEARGFGVGTGRRGRLALDRRTRNALAAAMRQSEQGRALLGGGTAELDEAAEEREEQLRQLKGLLS